MIFLLGMLVGQMGFKGMCLNDYVHWRRKFQLLMGACSVIKYFISSCQSRQLVFCKWA